MIGRVIKDKYRIMDEVERGSVTTVYLARDVTEGRVVALKILHLDLVNEGQFLRRFQREAKLLAKLNSPQAAELLDYGTDAGLYFMVFGYIPGKTVATILEEEGALEVEQALDIARQVAQCLAAAEQVGIVHRDIRPANIMVTSEGQVKVMDFGIARGVDLSHLTATGAVGSPHYLSPELAEGKEVDIRSDIYSLGVTLYEMLTGERPYEGTSAMDIVLKHLQEPIPSLQERDKEIPAEVDELVARCLAKDPADRFQTSVDLIEAINKALGQAEGLPAPGMEDALSGQTLGQYRLVGRLGRGGAATVYKAYQPSLDRYVAVKVLPTYLAQDPDFAARFKREARAIAKLNHPNILTVHDYGQKGDLSYIVMRYVPGGTLKEMLGQPLDFDMTVEIIAQAGRALDYAHQQGIVHRDVKPSNVLIAEGNWALLSDFGLAQIVGASVQITKTGTGMGTPAYMSPEQAQGTGADARSDIYSLGIVLFEMLTGRVPFEADTALAVLVKHLTAPLPLPREINPAIPEPVERVILKAVAKAPEDRYQRAGEMVEALEKAAEEVKAEERRGQQEKLAPLYTEAVEFLEAKEWQKALDKWAEVQAIEPGYPDPQEVAATAKREIERLAEEKRRREQLAALYAEAVGFLKTREWQEALDKWAEVQAIEPGYRDSQKVATTARREIERLEREKRRQEKLATLYAEAVGFLEAKEWQKALDKWTEVQVIAPDYPDPQKVTATARREITRLAEEKRRQEELAALHTEAVEFLKAEEWQKALDKWAEVGLVTVEEEAVPVWQRVPVWVWGAAIGGAILLVVMGGVLLAGQEGSPILSGLWGEAKQGIPTLVDMALSYWLPLTLIVLIMLLWIQRRTVAFAVGRSKAVFVSRLSVPSVRERPLPRPARPPVALPPAALLVVKGENMGSEYLLEADSAVIGRASECDVIIKDEAASRQHARLSHEGDCFVLSDLGSANGTFVNGRRISIPLELRDGDRIQIGETVLEFRELIGPDELKWRRKPDRLVALQNDWQGALKSLHDDEAFRSHAAAIVANMGDSLGFKMLSQGEKRRRLISFSLDAPTLLLNIPSVFPALFLQRELVTPRDVEDLRYLIDDLGGTRRFCLFIALQDLQETHSLFDEDELLQSKCTLIVLGEEDIARIVRMRDHRRALVESILNQVDLTAVSPFVIMGPVPENMFFGRENEIRKIVQTIRNNSMAILGGRRIGKTSILQKVERLLSRSDNGYRILYLNCQGVSSYEEFFRSINVGDWQPPMPIADFSPISFKEFIMRLKTDGEGPIVVILDETDRILLYDMDNDEKLFKVFRGLSEERHCQFLFSGERVLSMQMRDSRSPLFNFCNPLPLRYLERKDAEQLITEPMAQMSIELQRPSELIEEILSISSCHPRVVQYICDQLIQRISQEGSRIIRLDDLHRVTISNAFYNDYIDTIWAQALPLERLITLIMIQRQDQADSEMSAPDQKAMVVEGLTSTVIRRQDQVDSEIPAPDETAVIMEGLTSDEMRQALGKLGIELKAEQVNLALENLQMYAIVEQKENRYRFIPQAFPRFLTEVKDISEEMDLLKEQIQGERRRIQ